jgi:triose/dihydroxyacetone kinase / FAD-AMP lyase (cyclizing)
VCADAAQCARAAADAAKQGAALTKDMPGAAGRAGNVAAEALQGIPDPGAHAVAVWCQAIADAIDAEASSN